MILLVESGSTKTDWRLLDDNTTIQSAKTDGINPYFQTTDAIILTLQEQLSPELVAKEITEIYYYGTGITDAAKGGVVEHALKFFFKHVRKLEINSDMVAAARGLFGRASGIAAILGTGSNSCFYDGKDITFQVPPLGFWLGDEGGGGHLGKQLVLSYLHKELSVEMRSAFEREFGVLNRLEIIQNAYQKPNPNRYFAAFAPFLLENRANPQVSALIEGSFAAFFNNYLLKYPGIEELPVGFIGSIAFHFAIDLQSTAAKHGIRVSKILQSPMSGLIEYYVNRS